MILYESNIAVTVAELTDPDNGAIMSYSNYKKLAIRGSLSILRPGKGLDHPALIDYHTLPERFRKKYVAKYGDPEKVIREKESMLEINEDARTFFSGHVLPDGSRLKEKFIDEYTLNASVLDRLVSMENTQRAARNMRNNRTPVSWEAIMEESDRLRDIHGHTLPKGQARLRDKMRQYRRSGFECLVSGKLSNTNTAKVSEDGLEILLKLKRSRFPVYTNAQILEEYNRIASSRGWKRLRSQATVNGILESPEMKPKWYAAVYGELKAKQLFARQHITVFPTCRDALWYGDGTKINLYYKTYRDGKAVMASLQVFEVVDAYSEAFIGHYISEQENFKAMYWAYRMALEFSGHKPYELVYDNQGGTKRTDAIEFLSKVAVCSRPTAPHNAQSKTIESIFGRFQSQVLHKHWFFTGGNITAKSDRSRANMEYILANIDKLPTREEVIRIYEEDRRIWNSLPHYKYKECHMSLYMSSQNSRAIELTDALRDDLFWLSTVRESTFTSRGITITIDGEEMTYDVYGEDRLSDQEWRTKYTNEKFIVKYLPGDLSVVRLYKKDKNYGLQFVTEAKPYEVFHRALQDQTPEERSRLAVYAQRQKEQRVADDIAAQEFDIRHGIAPEQHGLRSPKLSGISDCTYERIADKLTKKEGQPADDLPVEEMPPVTIGQYQKQMSNMDIIAACEKF